MDNQTKLRDSILNEVLAEISSGRVTIVEAAAACNGALATIIGSLPTDNHSVMINLISKNLPDLVAVRSTQIKSGQVDREANLKTH